MLCYCRSSSRQAPCLGWGPLGKLRVWVGGHYCIPPPTPYWLCLVYPHANCVHVHVPGSSLACSLAVEQSGDHEGDQGGSDVPLGMPLLSVAAAGGPYVRVNSHRFR